MAVFLVEKKNTVSTFIVPLIRVILSVRFKLVFALDTEEGINKSY